MFIPYYGHRYYSLQTYQNLMVLESCEDALNEGVFDERVISTVLSYTHSTTLEILENVKEALLNLCSMVLSALNNFIINHAKYADKYRATLKERIGKLDKPFIFEYYDYKFVKDFPRLLKNGSEIETEIRDLQDKIRTEAWTEDKVSTAVDRMLEWFGEQVIGEVPDVTALRSSVRRIVVRRIQGDPITKGIDERSIDQFIDQIKSYKPQLDDIKKTKSSILADYNMLKKAYAKAIKAPDDVRNADKLKSAYDPDWYAFMTSERRRFQSISTEMSRLFNGFIEIYEAAFDTKLNILRERVDRNRAILVELMRRTSLIAQLNTKEVDKDRKPFKPEPTLIV